MAPNRGPSHISFRRSHSPHGERGSLHLRSLCRYTGPEARHTSAFSSRPGRYGWVGIRVSRRLHTAPFLSHSSYWSGYKSRGTPLSRDAGVIVCWGRDGIKKVSEKSSRGANMCISQDEIPQEDARVDYPSPFKAISRSATLRLDTLGLHHPAPGDKIPRDSHTALLIRYMWARTSEQIRDVHVLDENLQGRAAVLSRRAPH